MSDSEEEFTSIEQILKENKIEFEKNNPNEYSNFNDAINDNLSIDPEGLLEVELKQYFFQPQFKNNLCNFKIVGYVNHNSIPTVKIGQFMFMSDVWTVCIKIYNIDEIRGFYNSSVSKFDVFLLLLKKDNKTIIFSIVYNITKRNNLYNHEGKYTIEFKYNDTNFYNQKTEIIKLADLDNLPSFNKSVELLIEQFTNQLVLDYLI